MDWVSDVQRDLATGGRSRCAGACFFEDAVDDRQAAEPGQDVAVVAGRRDREQRDVTDIGRVASQTAEWGDRIGGQARASHLTDSGGRHHMRATER